ncbi:uncharacterized protein Utrn_0 isoform X2 [Zeugodacus cucurbitae]|uniref:uncharacterized protein Utrn_0 isoform X2 n=1 Tax=Zeugodacus cucurbitae TaxID=28588 RepID=UPI0023D90D83|nr:uncharacterized protein Utrn_0 isoform X2 [Zeugodacus cucurbitae]
MEGLEEGRKSVAQFRKSIYGGDEVDFTDIFQFDIDEEDHKKILSVMRDSLQRLPDSFRSNILDRFIEEHPELNWKFEGVVEQEQDHDNADILSTYSYDSLIPARWMEVRETFHKKLRPFSSAYVIRDSEKFWAIIQATKVAHFESIRAYAIEKLSNDMNNSLYMLYKLNQCNDEDFKLDDYRHFHVFSWTEDRFLARRQMKGIAWVDIFRRSLPANCLNDFKLRYDIMELVRILKPLLSSFNTTNAEFVTETKDIIENARQLLDLHEKIIKELEDNLELFCQKVNQITNISLQRRSAGRDVLKNYFELETLAYVVRDPMEYRYQVNFYKQRTADWQHYFDKQESQIEEELHKIRKKHNAEVYCYTSMMQCIYGIIEALGVKTTNSPVFKI